MNQAVPVQVHSKGRLPFGKWLFFVLVAMSICADAQQVPCDNGIVSLPYNVNGKVIICSALAAKVPELSRQLSDLAKAQGTQGEQLKEIARLIKGMNGVSQNIGEKRQVEFLNNISSQLAASQKAGNEQTERKISALADSLDNLKDQLLAALANRATAEKASAAVDGRVGDSIAKLDFAGAQSVLEDIRTQLKAIGGQVGEVNERTKEIQQTLGEQRMEVGRVKEVLASADVSALKRLAPGTIQPSVIEESFRQKSDDGKSTVARRFFENSIDSPQAMEWFDAILGAGVDPNMTLPGTYYDREGIMVEAMRAGNVQAMKILLRRGASPHPYQDVFLTRFPNVRFLFPISFIAEDDRISLRDKQDLAQAFLNAGAVIPKLVPLAGFAVHSENYEAKKLQDDIAPKLGMKLPQSATLCEQSNTAICQRASSRGGDDWCKIIAATPKKLGFVYGKSGGSPLYDVNLLNVLTIEKNKAYYLGVTDYLGPDYILVEVSKDGSSWTVLRYMSPEAGMGLCKKDEPDDSFRAEYCWRRIPLHRVAGTDEMRFDAWGLSWKIVANGCTTAAK